MVREDIETSIDRILEYVRRTRGAKLNDVAAAVGRPPGQVEKLALLLEEKKLLEVHYYVTGVRITPPKDPAELALGQPPGEGTLEEEKRLEREVLTSENIGRFFVDDLSRRISVAEGMLKDLEKRPYTAEEIEMVSGEVSLSIKQLEIFGRELEELEKREEEFKKKLEAFKKKLETMTPVERERALAASTLKGRIKMLLEEFILFMKFVKMEVTSVLNKTASMLRRPKQKEKPKQQLAPMVALARNARPAEQAKPPAPRAAPSLPSGLAFLQLPKPAQPAVVKQKAAKTKMKPRRKKKPVARRKAAKAKRRKAAGSGARKGFRRILEKRKDRVREHYWVKRKK